MNIRKRMGDSTEPCGTPLFIVLHVEQCPSTTAAMDRSERKLEMRVQGERENPKEDS